MFIYQYRLTVDYCEHEDATSIFSCFRIAIGGINEKHAQYAKLGLIYFIVANMKAYKIICRRVVYSFFITHFIMILVNTQSNLTHSKREQTRMQYFSQEFGKGIVILVYALLIFTLYMILKLIHNLLTRSVKSMVITLLILTIFPS